MAQNGINALETILAFFNRISLLFAPETAGDFILYQPVIRTLAGCASFSMSAIPHSMSAWANWTTS
jgi:hypothetical protein